MANAVAARIHGDDYQALVFWKHACRLLREEDDIESIEIESADLKSLDDVVINFKDGHLDSQGRPLKREGFQVKYHVDYRGCLNAEALIDPSFINATSISFLQRAFNLWKEYGREGLRFAFCSIWAIDHNDPLSELVSGDDGHVLTEKLLNAGARSKFGRVREIWRSHLNTDVSQLLSFLKSVRILVGAQKALLFEHVNNEFVLAGLYPIGNDASVNPYYELARTLIKYRSTRLTREDLLKICQKSNLWKGQPISIKPMKRVGVRSRLLGTEGFDEWTKTRLDLLSKFDDRQLKDGYTWYHDILAPVDRFLQAELRMGDSCEMWLPVHSTIAVAIGYILDAKSGVDVHMIQTSVSGTDTWCNKKSCGGGGRTESDWTVCDVSMNDGQDLAIAISVVYDIQQDVCSYIHEMGLKVSALRSFCCIDCGPRAIAGQEQAVTLIEKVIDSVRKFKRGASRTSILHVFFAMPNFMAFALGQRLRPLGLVQLYEHNFDSGYGADYAPSLQLPPLKGEM